MLTHMALAIAYAFIAPYKTPGLSNGVSLPDLGAPDEFAHANFVRHFAREHTLPIYGPKNPLMMEEYENHQPPLFYIIDGLWANLLGVSNFEAQGSGVQLRLINSLFGAATVAGVYFLGVYTLGRSRERLALVAAGITALLPMMAAMSGSLSNDPLLFALCTWCLALLARALTDGWTRKLALGIGVLAGLALLTKLTAYALLPVLLLALILRFPKGTAPNPGRTALIVGLVLVVPVLIALPWWLRNQSVYGHPLALNVFAEVSPRTVNLDQILHDGHARLRWAYVFGAGSLLSFIGVFGYMDIHLPNEFYFPLIAVLLLSFLAGLFAPKELKVGTRGVWWVLGVFTLLVCLGYLQYNLYQVQPQARYVMLAIGPIALYMALGMRRLFKSKASVVAGVVLFGLLLANLYAVAILPGEFSKRIEALKAQTRT